MLPLLLAVLGAGLVPHLHAHAGAFEAGVERVRHATDDGTHAAWKVDGGGCLACRSGQSHRLAAVASEPLVVHVPVSSPGRLLPEGPGPAIARLLRSAAPTRAPPV